MFTHDETYRVGEGGFFPLTVQYHVTVTLDCAASAANRPAGSSPFAGPVCGCQSRPEGQVIDASDPIVNTHEVSLNYKASSEMDIDDINTLIIGVTCEGRPVKNAEVEVELTPEERSGGHDHSSERPPRPRGYLNGTKITDDAPTITVHTGATGTTAV